MAFHGKGLFLFDSMKTEISPAIIMRVKEFGETDLLVAFFTAHKGLLKGVAKAARRSRRRFVNCFDKFSLVSLEYGLKKEGGLWFLHSGRLINGHPDLPSDFASLSAASYLIELTEVLFPSGVSDPRMFDLLKDSLASLTSAERAVSIPLVFEARALTLGGYRVNLEKCSECGRPYKGEGMAVFKPEKGGIACLKCHQPSHLYPSMTPDAVGMLEMLQEGSFSVSEAEGVADDIMKSLKTVLKLHREYRMEQRLKTSKYLE
jgi:DNA repair protein RecO (recombination protein O)